MLKSIIIDDEEDARFNLKHLLERKFADTIQVLGEADGVKSGLEIIEKTQPDLVFLDIKMRDGTGFDLIQNLDTVNFEIIFVTAYDKFAIQAMEFSAFAYLMKPINPEKLQNAVEQLIEKRKELKNSIHKRIKILIENYGDTKKVFKLIVSNVEGFDILQIEDIIRLEGDSNYTHFILPNEKKVVSSKSLGVYEELLIEYGFFRIHQSTIINLRHVKAYKKSDGGQVKMSDDVILKISRHRKKDFFDRFLN